MNKNMNRLNSHCIYLIILSPCKNLIYHCYCNLNYKIKFIKYKYDCIHTFEKLRKNSYNNIVNINKYHIKLYSIILLIVV